MIMQDWMNYLLGGLNTPSLVSRIALLPQASSKWAAEALMAADDARALAAAERALHQMRFGGAEVRQADGGPGGAGLSCAPHRPTAGYRHRLLST